MRAFVPLESPELAGEMTVPETAELRARLDMETELLDQLSALDRQRSHLVKLRTVVANEKEQFLAGLLGKRGLPPEDQYAYYGHNGRIERTARAVPESEAEPVPQEGDG